ncbi:MAG: hypothetical protein IJ085_03805, partial [Turicibacter sp.]|nr:hypothetical protein [Turicibacter sp.]
MLLNQQLWSIYQMATKRDSIRGLFLYEVEGDRGVSYKFLMISTNPTSFFMDIKWLTEIDDVYHIEKEYSFDEDTNHYFNFYTAFKSGWSTHFFVTENEQQIFSFNMPRLTVFIDRDEVINLSQSVIDSVSHSVLIPNEEQLRELALEFYENALLQSHFFKSQSVNQLPKSSMERIIIQLLQGLSGFKSYLLEEDYQLTRNLIDFMKNRKETLDIHDFLEDLKLGNRLFGVYSKLLKCP